MVMAFLTREMQTRLKLVLTNVGYNRDQLITLINQRFTTTLAPNGLAIATGSADNISKGIHTFVKMCECKPHLPGFRL